jgi:hypothetical protein
MSIRELIPVLVIAILTSCSQNRDNVQHPEPKADLIIKKDTSTKKINYKPKTDNEYYDSLERDDIIRTNNILKHISDEIYNNSNYTITTDSFAVKSGNLFTTEIHHSHIHLQSSLGYDLIQITNSNKILFSEKYFNTYCGDTIFDVNNDGFNDFLLKWYPSSGCCVANIFDVYIYNSNTDTFNYKIELINPTFIPNESMVICVGYGWPGEMKASKIDLSEHKADTIEILNNIGTEKPIIRRYNIIEDRVDTIYHLPEYYRNAEYINLFFCAKERNL